jgi:hypothetical protein
MQVRILLWRFYPQPILQSERFGKTALHEDNYNPAEYAGGLREKVFDRAGPQAWSDYKQSLRRGRNN